MITLIYTGTNPKLSKAVATANEVLSGEAFYERIATMREYGEVESREIAENIKKTNLEIIVESYRNPFGKKATKSVNPFRFKVNTSKISSVVAFAVHSLIRQTVMNISLNHKKRTESILSTEKYKSESLPNQIGEIAEIISRKTLRFATTI